MGKQSRSKKPEFVGKGKVTPVQIAFIVDRYLLDNSYTRTRSTFRSEASHLIAKSPVQEAPKSLLSLGAILDEYITLKEHKVWVDQERCRLEQEKLRVQNLLSGMQAVMNAYNTTGNNAVTPPLLQPPPAVASAAVSSQAELAVVRPAGHYPMYNTPAMMSTSRPSNIRKDPTNISTPVAYQTATKRKGAKDIPNDPACPKRSRRCTQSKDVNLVTQSNNTDKSLMNSAAQSLACHSNAPSDSPAQGSNVVKCLFNQDPPSPPTNSSIPKTPPRASSSQTNSPLEICSTATSSQDISPHQIMSANCTIISSETIRVSPNKQISYYSIEKNHISTCSPLKSHPKKFNTKDHVKGRLDFGASEMPLITENQSPDGNTTSESEKEGDILGLDFPNLDAFGLDFNLSEFLFDFDMGNDGQGLSSMQALDSSPDSHSGSENVEMGARQVTSQFDPTMGGFLGHNDMNLVGTDSVQAMRSVTKCIIVSPVKGQKSNLGQENLADRN